MRGRRFERSELWLQRTPATDDNESGDDQGEQAAFQHALRAKISFGLEGDGVGRGEGGVGCGVAWGRRRRVLCVTCAAAAHAWLVLRLCALLLLLLLLLLLAAAAARAHLSHTAATHARTHQRSA